MKKSVITTLFLLLAAGPVYAGMSSASFQINWDSLNEGGSDSSSSTNFSVRDTVGDNGSGTSTSSNFQLSAGYRAPEGADMLTFVVRGQSSATQTAFTAFSNGAKTVTVASSASYVAGDYIAVVENEGFSQKVAVGKILNVAGLVLTVDAWEGDNSWISAIPAGGNDYVYNMSSNSAAFGTISSSTAYTSVALTSVQTTVASGYTVYLLANQQLQNASSDIIDAVTDGTVTIGSEEYGASVTGTRAFGAGTDTGVTTTQRVIQMNVNSAPTTPDRVAMTYKLSVISGTPSGSYSQTVGYTVTANY
jgi:hypothetical protein